MTIASTDVAALPDPLRSEEWILLTGFRSEGCEHLR